VAGSDHSRRRHDRWSEMALMLEDRRPITSGKVGGAGS
jgi:hypothetical protein